VSAAGRRQAGALGLAALCALASAGCANTLQNQPIAHNILEGMLVAPYPVYWLGGSFRGSAITEVAKDPSGAFRLQYGDCVQGGQSTCTPVLRVVTSPDNGFIPGGESRARAALLRGVSALVSEAGRTIELATAGVVVSIHSPYPALAAGAAQTAVPINEPGAPLAALPARLPDTGFADSPLPAQLPSPLHAPPGPALLR
jgi:hypothetical protein